MLKCPSSRVNRRGKRGWYLDLVKISGGMEHKQVNWTIAQFLGWKRLSGPVEIKYFWREGSQTSGMATLANPEGNPALDTWVPDFCRDLNALRTAETALSIDQEYVYGEALAAECRREENAVAGEPPDNNFPFNGWGYYSLATLPALTRATILARLVEKKTAGETATKEH